MDGLRWYWRRLAVMSPREVLHRIGSGVRLQSMRIERLRPPGEPRAEEAKRYAFCMATTPQLPELPYEPLSDAALEQALAGDFPALGYAWRWHESPLVWQRAPDTGRLWPARFFADIDFRTGNPHGDARVIWEPARLQSLLTLARAARQAPERASFAVARLERMLDSWITGNPHLTGIHYVSAMECGLRLIAVSHALDLSRGLLSDPEKTWCRFAWLARSHATLIVRRLSQHSSAGNHTVAECTALLYAAVLLREERGASAWRRRALEILTQESERQVLADGGGIEQAFWYHLFVLDLLGLAASLLAHHAEAVPVEIASALERGRAFLKAFGASPAELPGIGDADGGYALSSDLRVSFDTHGPADRPCSRTFRDSGYSLRSSPGGALRVIFDHGPLGMAPGYGHGHADALAVTVSICQRRILIDPGTYSYNAGVQWRRYFHGTCAHNTVLVDGEDQSIQAGQFLWSGAALAELMAADERRLLGRHDGYARLGIRHWRGLLLLDESLVVWDLLEGAGEHQFDLHWHLGTTPTCRPGSPGAWLLGEGGWQLAARGGEATLHEAQADPPLGWAAPAYGERHPITTLRVRHRGPAPHEFVTFLGPNAAGVSVESAVAEMRELRRCLPTA